MEVIVSGLKMLIDDQDEGLFRSRRWFANPQGYLCCKDRTSGRGRTRLFHRMILEPIPDGMVVDHINRDRQDNRRENLRVVSNSENCRNIGSRPNKTSKYRGVSWNAESKKWQVVLRIDGKLRWIGAYESEDAAGAVAAPHFIAIAA